MSSRQLRAVMVCLSVSIASKSLASGIPVVDILTRDTVAAVGTQISGAITVQTDALVKALSAHSNNNFVHMKAALAYEAQRETMKEHDPNLVKPREACSLIALAKNRPVAHGMVKETGEHLKDLGYAYLQSGINFVGGGATAGKQSSRVVQGLSNLQNARAASKTGLDIMSDHALEAKNNLTGRDEAAEKISAMNLIAFPFVQPLLNGDYANPKAALRDKRANAPRGIQIERQKIVSSIFAKSVADQDRILPSENIKQWAIADGMSVKNIPERISASEQRNLKATMRINSPAWIAQTSGKSDLIGLARSRNLMLAESLVSINDVNKRLARQELLLAYIYAAIIENNGPPKEQI